MRIIVATTNKKKFKEMQRILEREGIKAVFPEERIEVEERGNSFLENACIKAEAYYEYFNTPVIADDSGLVVDALDGYPGIYSSRFYSLEFGGKEKLIESPDVINVKKLLKLLKGQKNRKARFVAVVFFRGKEAGVFASAECEGIILEEPRGDKGFGYDPVFQPLGFDKSMAELEPWEKDSISHRGKALKKLSLLLKSCGKLL